MLIDPRQWTRFPPDPRSPQRARRLLRETLIGAGLTDRDDHAELDDLADTALLLASELFDNAVLHAGTEFDVGWTITAHEITIAVRDHGMSPLEQHLAQPRRSYGRAPTHGRGLMLIQKLATAWGTRHDTDGLNTIWFTLHPDPPHGPRAPAPLSAVPDVAVGLAESVSSWPDSQQVRRLLSVSPALGARLDLAGLVAELTRRLREVLDVDGASVEVDDGDGRVELARDGTAPGPRTPPTRVLEVHLPLTPPLRGRIRLTARPGGMPPAAREIAELSALRIALSVEADWLRGADRRRQAWMTYLADTSQLLGQSLDVDLTVTVIPQVIVPRLGQWCAVHLDRPTRGLELRALSHTDEDRLPELRAALDPAAAMPAPLCTQLRGMTDPSAPIWLHTPTDGIGVPLTAAGRRIGVLTVGRPAHRAHTLEDIALIQDIARRSALAIDNAQRATHHAHTSQALQQALLPRELPTAAGIAFAAQYLPATTGHDVGGDFYDVITLGPGHWLAVIGDVCGKGAQAAARTGQVRDVLRVLIREHHPLPHALHLLNDTMLEARDPAQFCTLAAADIHLPGDGEPAGLHLDLVLAGHERPLLIRAAGTTRYVGHYGTALGLTRTLQLTRTRHHLAPGDTLLTYTDGVTERRSPNGLYGPDRLLTAATHLHTAPPAHLVTGIRAAVEHFSRDVRRDDLALLAIHATHPVAEQP